MAGYSMRSLIEKIGIREGMTVSFPGVSHDLKNKIAILPRGCVVVRELKEPVDFIWTVSHEKKELEEKFPQLRDHLKRIGMLWVSWPKGSSKIETDLNENIIREIGLNNGMVDVKVIAVTDDYSGLKFVFRLKDR